MEQNIYFDNGSTSWPKAPGVAASMTKLLESGAFNINREITKVPTNLKIRYLRPACSSPDFFMHRIPDVSYLHRGSPIL